MDAARAGYDGAAGRIAREVLRAGWPGTRVLKSAVAAGVAWYVAARFGDPAPMFAVFGALNGMQTHRGGLAPQHQRRLARHRPRHRAGSG
jgi:hypothetical protein